MTTAKELEQELDNFGAMALRTADERNILLDALKRIGRICTDEDCLEIAIEALEKLEAMKP